MNEIPAPVIIFAYNRAEELCRTLEALFSCIGIEEHSIYIFCDGQKNENDKVKTNQVKTYLKLFEGQKSITIQYAEFNKGLAKSIIEGVTQIFEKYESVIVLEDDLIVSKNFLLYMNQAINFYKNEEIVYSISGYSPILTDVIIENQDIYFTPRANSLGWATWKNRWEKVDWEVLTYNSFKYNLLAQCQFAKGGIDLPGMLRNQMNGRINSWAIRWVYHQYLTRQVTVYPSISKLNHIGIGANATNTKRTFRFETILDDGSQTVFSFKVFDGYDEKVLISFRKVFSIWRRLKDRF
jgi:hypothetical protein